MRYMSRRSVCSRARLSSTCCRMCRRESPRSFGPGPTGLNTFELSRSCRSQVPDVKSEGRSIPTVDSPWLVEPTRCSMARSWRKGPPEGHHILPTMRWLLIIAASLATSTTLDVFAMHRAAAQAARDARPRVVLDNARVRVYRATAGSLTGVDHGPAVVVSLEDSPGARAGSAVWAEDAAAPSRTSQVRGSIVLVQPRLHTETAAPPARP